MTARVQINRFTATGQRPPSSRPVGEIYANYADNQFGIIDYTPGVRDLLAIRYHSTTGAYTTGDYVLAGTGSSTSIYKATIAVVPGAFNSASWDLIPTLSQADARYLKITGGGVVTGPVTFLNTVTLAGDPTLPLQAATKQYVDTRVFRSGDTMTGYLTLVGDPTLAMHAATAQYVNNQIAGSNLFLRLTGGTLSGELTVGGSGIHYLNITPADRHAMAFGWNGTLYATVNSTYVGVVATREFVSGAYLPLTGGTVSGTLVVNGELQTAAILRINNTGAFFHSYADETYINWDGGGWSLRYQRSTGLLWYRRGGDGLNLFAVDGGGSGVFAGNLNAGLAIAAGGNVYARGGSVWFGWADRTRLQSDNATFAALNVLDNHRLQFNWSDGNWRFINASEVTLMTLDGGGSIAVIGNASANGNIHAAGAVTAVGGQMHMGNGGAGRLLQMSPSWYWDWNGGTGTLIWNRPGGYFWVMDATVNFCYNNMGPVGGVGGYVTLSDERAKADIVSCDLGLDDLLQIKPIMFTRPGRDKREIGFSAQNVHRVIPEAVHPFGHDLPDGEDPDSTSPALGVSLDPIVAAMVNAMREFDTRLTQLEDDA